MPISKKAIIKTTKPMTVAFIKVKGSYSQIPIRFGELYGWITEKEYKPIGSAIVVYHTTPGQVPDDQSLWELRSQLSGNVVASGPDEQGIGVKRVGEVQVASAIHKGPYEKIEQTYNALTDWITKNNYEIKGPYEESYFNSPEQVPVDELITEIRFPIQRKSQSS
jgi:effector-binding domain-containing protein